MHSLRCHLCYSPRRRRPIRRIIRTHHDVGRSRGPIVVPLFIWRTGPPPPVRNSVASKPHVVPGACRDGGASRIGRSGWRRGRLTGPIEWRSSPRRLLQKVLKTKRAKGAVRSTSKSCMRALSRVFPAVSSWRSAEEAERYAGGGAAGETMTCPVRSVGVSVGGTREKSGRNRGGTADAPRFIGMAPVTWKTLLRGLEEPREPLVRGVRMASRMRIEVEFWDAIVWGRPRCFPSAMNLGTPRAYQGAYRGAYPWAYRGASYDAPTPRGTNAQVRDGTGWAHRHPDSRTHSDVCTSSFLRLDFVRLVIKRSEFCTAFSFKLVRRATRDECGVIGRYT
jgi:hypothetical protein